jgi:hypothetical protein
MLFKDLIWLESHEIKKCDSSTNALKLYAMSPLHPNMENNNASACLATFSHSLCSPKESS